MEIKKQINKIMEQNKFNISLHFRSSYNLDEIELDKWLEKCLNTFIKDHPEIDNYEFEIN